MTIATIDSNAHVVTKSDTPKHCILLFKPDGSIELDQCFYYLSDADDRFDEIFDNLPDDVIGVLSGNSDYESYMFCYGFLKNTTITTDKHFCFEINSDNSIVVTTLCNSKESATEQCELDSYQRECIDNDKTYLPDYMIGSFAGKICQDHRLGSVIEILEGSVYKKILPGETIEEFKDRNRGFCLI